MKLMQITTQVTIIPDTCCDEYDDEGVAPLLDGPLLLFLPSFLPS